MPAQVLIDTSALLALLHRDDRWHTRCVETSERLRVPWATSTAVLTEFFYLASHGPLSVATAWDFVRSGIVMLLPIDNADLPSLDYLMRKYADRPMDLADATLVHLARREDLSTVFTSITTISKPTGSMADGAFASCPAAGPDAIAACSGVSEMAAIASQRAATLRRRHFTARRAP